MEGNFQIATNFHYGNGPDPYMPNRRYTIGTNMLEDSKNHSINGFKKILFAVHQDGRNGNPTSYSNIYDLKNNKIYTYNFYNFSEPYIIDMNTIFKEGKKIIKFSDIFEFHSYLSEIHYLAKLNEHLVLLIKEKGVRDVLSNLNKMEEYSMIGSLCGVDYANLGYTLINEQIFSEAIEVFSYNIEKFPKNAGDNYANIAKVHLINKDTTNAIKNYKIASELNPKYEWVLDGLKAKINPIKIDEKILKTYVGNYGPRNVFIEEGELFYQRENGPKYKMIPINENYFYFDEIEYFRLRFIRKNSVIIGVDGLYDDGRIDSNLRTNK
jgi:tetratricopeptide (TPR) repeat protein